MNRLHTTTDPDLRASNPGHRGERGGGQIITSGVTFSRAAAADDDDRHDSRSQHHGAEDPGP